MSDFESVDTRPPVAPIERHYARLRNGMIARPIIDDHAWLRQGLKQHVDPYLELVWFDDGRCHPSSGLEEFTDEYDIIATISPEAMALAAQMPTENDGPLPPEFSQVWDDNREALYDGEPADTATLEPMHLGSVPIIDTNRLARLEALISIADAVLDHADSHCRWFDISTAPKDGTIIQLGGGKFFCEARDCDISEPVSASWTPSCWLMVGLESGYVCASYNDPTHWAPLPPPPSNPPLPAVFTELGAALEKIKGANS